MNLYVFVVFAFLIVSNTYAAECDFDSCFTVSEKTFGKGSTAKITSDTNSKELDDQEKIKELIKNTGVKISKVMFCISDMIRSYQYYLTDDSGKEYALNLHGSNSYCGNGLTDSTSQWQYDYQDTDTYLVNTQVGYADFSPYQTNGRYKDANGNLHYHPVSRIDYVQGLAVPEDEKTWYQNAGGQDDKDMMLAGLKTTSGDEGIYIMQWVWLDFECYELVLEDDCTVTTNGVADDKTGLTDSDNEVIDEDTLIVLIIVGIISCCCICIGYCHIAKKKRIARELQTQKYIEFREKQEAEKKKREAERAKQSKSRVQPIKPKNKSAPKEYAPVKQDQTPKSAVTITKSKEAELQLEEYVEPSQQKNPDGLGQQK